MKGFKQFIIEGYLHSVKDKWVNKDAENYVGVLFDTFGDALYYGEGIIKYQNIAGFDEVMVKDESIKHDFPTPHKDFVYSYMKLNNSQVEKLKNYISSFSIVTGSISFDPLKRIVRARCGMLIKNAVTLGFITDGLETPMLINKDAYSRRIINNEYPSWYKNELDE